jgi:hypothetical protein
LIITLCRVFTIIPFILGKYNLVGDYLVVLTMIIFSWTNGLFSTLAMMYGQKDTEGQEKETAGFLMSLFLKVGIVSGAAVAPFIQKI